MLNLQTKELESQIEHLNLPKLSRVTVYGASEKSEALFYGEASAEGGNPVTMSISF